MMAVLPNDEPAYSIGVDLGGTNLRVAVYSSALECVELITLSTRLQNGPEAVLRDMCEAIASLRLRSKNLGRFAGVGVGTPGPLELPAGVIRNAPNLPGWDGYDIRGHVEAAVGLQIILECDANVAALAEFLLGPAPSYGASSLCMLTLGTGVGSGLVLDGAIWHGEHGMGGEAGHITVDPQGALCGCGNHGCLEQVASATAVRRMFLESAAATADVQLVESMADPGFGAKEIAELARLGHPVAQEVFRRAGRGLGLALASLINTLDLPLFVIGGGLIGAWDLFAPEMAVEVHRRSYVYRIAQTQYESKPARPIRIEPAHLGTASGITGAAALPFQQVRSLVEEAEAVSR
jgi:glucokinase